jgi:hypothetical protein
VEQSLNSSHYVNSLDRKLLFGQSFVKLYYIGRDNLVPARWSNTMHLDDLSLLLKKIAVGLVVTVVPLVILASGIWLTRALLDRAPAASATQTRH